MRSRWLVLLTIVLIVSAGCTGSTEGGDDTPSYTPVPDQDLFSQIDELPGVISSDISFNDNFPEKVYVGRVEIAPDADAQATLDAIYATLRQGRPDVDIGISGTQGDKAIRFDLLPGSGTGTAAQLKDRYGPQPGDGEPPASSGQ